MPILHTQPAPRQLPFHVDSFGWDHFESFCAAWFVAGTTLPNLDLSSKGPSRLRVVDAIRYGTGGSKQRGIDILATMETHATWVIQCKHVARFTEGEAQKAITKAEAEYGPQNPSRYLLWVTGTVATAAIDLVKAHHPNWTLWDGERLSQEFLLHTPRRQALDIISRSFDSAWAKAVFPLPDDLLISTEEFYSRWDGPDRLFHHHADFVGRGELVKKVCAFGGGGKGARALILSASGGVGKTRLLRAVAEKIESTAAGRIVRFTNPGASAASEPPRHENTAALTVIHDDAHRLETIPPLLLRILSAESGNGSRLILAARPGAEDALRELLMEHGYSASSIGTEKVGRLTRAEMEELAEACLGDILPGAARPLAALSEGCALITVAGAELLRRGLLNHLDLSRSDHFRAEVFQRFEGKELDRVRGSMNRRLLEKLLRSIALLSPWQIEEPSALVGMATFLGIQPGEVSAACDSLLAHGLAVPTRDGLRITPDLFSDHLAWIACYDPEGKSTPFIRDFLTQFAEHYSQSILRNLAEAEWRALQRHGSSAESVVAPIWIQFLENFQSSTFWERAQMLQHWAAFSVFQPERSIELAAWAMDLPPAPRPEFARSLDNPSIALEKIPILLKPVAIWSALHRHAALNLLWRLRRDYPSSSVAGSDQFAVFGEVASFNHNYPAAAEGALDWLEVMLESEDAEGLVNRPSGFIEAVLHPYFASTLEQNFMQDSRTFAFREVPVSVSKTRPVRDRALNILTEKIIPRGTVAAINALPVLSGAIHHPVFAKLTAAQLRAWLPEKRRFLQAIQDTAALHPHPLVHHAIRRLLHSQVVYGKPNAFTTACREIAIGLPDTFELRLARVTLSWCDDDSLDRTVSRNAGRMEADWIALTCKVTEAMMERCPNASAIHAFLTEWIARCEEHGLNPQLGGLLVEIADRDPSLGFDILEFIHRCRGSRLAPNSAMLLPRRESDRNLIESAIRKGLESDDPEIVCSFLKAIRIQTRLRTDKIRRALLRLTIKAEGQVMKTLIEHVRFPAEPAWNQDLANALLNRKVSDQEAENLADAIFHWARYGGGELTEGITSAVLERLGVSKKLNASPHQTGFIYETARRYPRLLFNALQQRMIRHEQEPESQAETIPDLPDLVLRGLENEPDFELLARDLFQRIRAATNSNRRRWELLFSMAVARNGSIVEKLLIDALGTMENPTELSDLARLIRFEGSLIVFQHPNLTAAFLKKARSFGPGAYDLVTARLINSAGPEGRSYTNGRLDQKYRYLLEEAEKANIRFESDPTLGPFFRKLLEHELRDATSNRLQFETEAEGGW